MEGNRAVILGLNVSAAPLCALLKTQLRLIVTHVHDPFFILLIIIITIKYHMIARNNKSHIHAKVM